MRSTRKRVTKDGTSLLDPQNGGICFHLYSLPGARSSYENFGPHAEVEEESCVTVRAGSLHPGLQNSTPPTNLSTVALAKPQEWKLNKNVS